MEAKFKYYEIVKVIKSDNSDSENLIGFIGVILGMAEDENGNWGYSVHINELEEVWDFKEEFLHSTGKLTNESDFFDGTFGKVKVNPESGEGSLNN
jgi:hypothetical protein